jgi:hypothetical protein
MSQPTMTKPLDTRPDWPAKRGQNPAQSQIVDRPPPPKPMRPANEGARAPGNPKK